MARPGGPLRTPHPKQLALTVTAGILAASALAGCDSQRPSAKAPICAPRATVPGSSGWDDPDGCWEPRPDGTRAYRTAFGGSYHYYSGPPGYSRYSDAVRGGWFSASKSSGGYRGAPSAAA